MTVFLSSLQNQGLSVLSTKDSFPKKLCSGVAKLRTGESPLGENAKRLKDVAKATLKDKIREEFIEPYDHRRFELLSFLWSRDIPLQASASKIAAKLTSKTPPPHSGRASGSIRC